MPASKKQRVEKVELVHSTTEKKAVLSDIKQKVLKLQEKADRKLEELTCMCQKEESNGK